MTGDFFLPGSTILHRFDGRAKLLCLVGSAAFFFYPLPLLWQAGALLLWITLTTLTIGIREAGVPIRSILPVLVLVAVLTPLFNREGPVVLSIRETVLLTQGGLAETCRMLVRFSGVTVLFYIFFRTTDLQHIILTLRWFGLPFQASLIITLAFRYIPHFADLYRQVADAHALRALRDSAVHRGPGKKLRLFFPTLTSVLIQSVRGIDPLSMALEVKGVGRKNERTSYGVLPKGAGFFAQFSFSCILTGVEILPLFLL